MAKARRSSGYLELGMLDAAAQVLEENLSLRNKNRNEDRTVFSAILIRNFRKESQEPASTMPATN